MLGPGFWCYFICHFQLIFKEPNEMCKEGIEWLNSKDTKYSNDYKLKWNSVQHSMLSAFSCFIPFTNRLIFN